MFKGVFGVGFASNDVRHKHRFLSMSGFWIPSVFFFHFFDFCVLPGPRLQREKSGRLAGQALAPKRNHLLLAFVVFALFFFGGKLHGHFGHTLKVRPSFCWLAQFQYHVDSRCSEQSRFHSGLRSTPDLVHPTSCGRRWGVEKWSRCTWEGSALKCLFFSFVLISCEPSWECRYHFSSDFALVQK